MIARNEHKLVECSDANKNSPLSEAAAGGDPDTIRLENLLSTSYYCKYLHMQSYISSDIMMCTYITTFYFPASWIEYYVCRCIREYSKNTN